MRRRRHESRGGLIPALFVCLIAGGVLGWWLRGVSPEDLIALPTLTRGAVPDKPAADDVPATSSPDAPPATPSSNSERSATSGETTVTATVPTIGADPIADLRRRHLRLPLDQARVSAMEGNFNDRRDGGERGHEAVDLMAPRLTPVHAVESGSIAKLFLSKAGGITIYQFDPSEQFCYYYAHLEKYADGLKEGQKVEAGDVIGYVGSTGNASPNAPHLHFAIFRLTDDHRWWKGTPLDPYLVFRP